MLPVPQSRAIAVARSSARSVSHGPGRRLPSHISAAARALRTSGAPLLVMLAVGDLVQVRRQQREPVRRVSEQVAVDEDRRDVGGDVVANAGTLEQRLRKTAQCLGAVADL